MMRSPRQKARVWLRLLLVLQIVGLLGHAAAWGASRPRGEDTSPELAALHQVVGYSVSICHHGGGRGPDPGSSGDCCDGGFCHCPCHVFDAPSPCGGLSPRLAVSATPRVGSRFAGIAPTRPAGAWSARGPPVFV